MSKVAIAAAALGLGLAANAFAAPQKLNPLATKGGAIAPGKYYCQDWDYYAGATITNNRITTQFRVTGPGGYAYIGSKEQPGTMAYTAGSGAIAFKTGPFAPDENGSMDGVFGRRQDGHPMIVLTYRLKGADVTGEYCTLAP
jgi:hypothetical protein